MRSHRRIVVLLVAVGLTLGIAGEVASQPAAGEAIAAWHVTIAPS